MGITEQSRLRKYVNWLMYVIDLIILAALTVMIATVSGYMIRDFSVIFSSSSTVNELKIIVDYILLLFIFSELLRSVLAARSEDYLLVLMETAVVVAIREIYVSVISKTTIDFVLSSIALTGVIVGLWLMKAKVFKQA